MQQGQLSGDDDKQGSKSSVLAAGICNQGVLERRCVQRVQADKWQHHSRANSCKMQGRQAHASSDSIRVISDGTSATIFHASTCSSKSQCSKSRGPSCFQALCSDSSPAWSIGLTQPSPAHPTEPSGPSPSVGPAREIQEACTRSARTILVATYRGAKVDSLGAPEPHSTSRWHHRFDRSS